LNAILLGPPGSGKGTQGTLLAERTGVMRVSTGDLLRAAVQQGTPLGLRAKGFMDAGLLVPDDVILGLIAEVLARPEAARGVIMDGFPRTVAQADAVGALLRQRGSAVDVALNFVVADAELVERMMGRAAKEGRSDDTPEAFQQRLSVYRQQTAPLIDYYRNAGVLVDIRGTGSVDEIAGRVRKAVGA
jgi:adenylate kinase